jgi:2-polyprenyl-6-methoxyphenol hydroxylase-like FAD-dependent oxidoreductase
MTDERTPVLIVGAGLAGLSAAMFLGVHGVRAKVVERHPTTSIYPKARGQFPHTMEALRIAGVDRRMIEASPPDPGFRIVVAESVTGRVYNDLLIDTNPDFSALSPAGWANTSQERAEPVLLARARELGADVRFGTELVSFTQNDFEVQAVLRDETGEHEIRADYLVAADGHRSPIRQALGIGTHGRGDLGRATGIVFEADLGVRGFALYYLQNPELPGGAGVVVSTDEPNRYALSVGHREDITEPEWISMIRTATGVPTLNPLLVTDGTATGYTSVRVADRFSSGRVHLIGDAVRVMPPTGGFGGNTAILDGYYLAWKLAMVLTARQVPPYWTATTPNDAHTRTSWSNSSTRHSYNACAQTWPTTHWPPHWSQRPHCSSATATCHPQWPWTRPTTARHWRTRNSQQEGQAQGPHMWSYAETTSPCPQETCSATTSCCWPAQRPTSGW